MRCFVSVSVAQVQRAGAKCRSRPMSGSPFPVEHLQRRARQLLLTGIARNSTSTYNTSISAFGKFRSFYGLPKQLPIPVPQIILFMSFCFEKGLSPKSISTYIAGINYYHKLCGFYDLSNVFLIRKLLEGCHRSRICA